MASFDCRLLVKLLLLLLLLLRFVLMILLLLLLVAILANRSVAVLAVIRRFAGGWSATCSSSSSSAEAGLQSLGDLGVDVLVHAAEQRIAALLVATRSGLFLALVLVREMRLRLVPGQTRRWLRRTTAAAGAKVLRFGVGIAPALALARLIQSI